MMFALSTTRALFQRRIVVLGMSGGVDSSVAALLLKEQLNSANNETASSPNAKTSRTTSTSNDNVSLIGLHMQNWDSADADEIQRPKEQQQQPLVSTSPHRPCNEQDYKDALQVCNCLQIPLKRVSFAPQYWTQVFQPFLASLSRTQNNREHDSCGIINMYMPNPDVDCNRYIKFGVMKEYCKNQFGGGRGGGINEDDCVVTVATGHYARLWHRNKSQEDNDNQTQPISIMNQQQVEKLLEENRLGGVDNDKESNTKHDRKQKDELQSVAKDDASFETMLSPHDAWIYSSNNNNKDQQQPSACWGNPDLPLLIAAADATKDQSYFLCGLSQESLADVVFPLGNLLKSTHVKPLARAYPELHPVAHKRESMGICFIGKRRGGEGGGFGAFVSQYLNLSNDDGSNDDNHDNTNNKKRRKNVDDERVILIDIETGQKIVNYPYKEAEKDTLSSYGAGIFTVGQNARIGGQAHKWFVVHRQAQQQQQQLVWVCNDTHHPALYADELYIKDMNWVASMNPPITPDDESESSSAPHQQKRRQAIPPPLLENGGTGSFQALCRTRHLQPLIPCTVSFRKKNKSRDNSTNCVSSRTKTQEMFLRIQFDHPVRAITPGQTAALYCNRGLVCLGGGPILDRGPSYFERGLQLPYFDSKENEI